MSYIAKNLLPDEQIFYRTKKHYVIFTVPIVMTLITLFFYFNPNVYLAKLTFLPALVALFYWGNTLLEYVTSEYAITNKRIMMKEGFFIRHANEARLTTISNVNINQNLLGQMFNYGTVVINTFGGKNDIFPLIAHPGEFQKQTQIQLDKIATLPR